MGTGVGLPIILADVQWRAGREGIGEREQRPPSPQRAAVPPRSRCPDAPTLRIEREALQVGALRWQSGNAITHSTQPSSRREPDRDQASS